MIVELKKNYIKFMQLYQVSRSIDFTIARRREQTKENKREPRVNNIEVYTRCTNFIR